VGGDGPDCLYCAGGDAAKLEQIEATIAANEHQSRALLVLLDQALAPWYSFDRLLHLRSMKGSTMSVATVPSLLTTEDLLALPGFRVPASQIRVSPGTETP
jgi:hypothetical protein